MIKNWLYKYWHSFFEILFLRLYPPQIKEFNVFNRFMLYALSVVFFYFPMVHSVITLCMQKLDFIQYFLIVVLLHAVAKFIRANSQKVQQRFSTVKTRKLFLLRVLLVVEYVVFMWIVYLLYPISCILFPFSMIFYFCGNLLGAQSLINWVMAHIDQYIFYGSLVSYIVFIFFDSYKKVLKGSLPGYLGLYAVLTAISTFVDGSIKISIPDGFKEHINAFSSIFSHIFNLSNQSLMITSTVIMFASAILSIYATCGLDSQNLGQAKNVPETKEKENSL